MGNESYGFQLGVTESGHNVIIGVHEGGLADGQGHLQMFDTVLAVNDLDVLQADRTELIKIMKSTNILNLVVGRLGSQELAAFKQTIKKQPSSSRQQSAARHKSSGSGQADKEAGANLTAEEKSNRAEEAKNAAEEKATATAIEELRAKAEEQTRRK